MTDQERTLYENVIAAQKEQVSAYEVCLSKKDEIITSLKETRGMWKRVAYRQMITIVVLSLVFAAHIIAGIFK